MHIFLYATFFCCLASFTFSFHHHVSSWFFLPFFFPYTLSQACSILFLKVFHIWGASTSTNSLTPFRYLVFMLFSFNFHILLLIVCLLFTTFFNFLLSMSVTTTRCCNFQGMASRLLNTFYCFCKPIQNQSLLHFLPYSMLFFSAPSFQTMYLLRTTPFHLKFEQTSSLNISFANFIPTMHTLKTINLSPNMSVKVL